MRIQLLSMSYAPDHTGIAPYVTALAKHLSETHEVTVIAGVPHYPEWRVRAGWRKWRAVETSGRLKVVRLRHYVPSSQSTARRLAYELSWVSRVLVESCRHEADVVIAFVPALLTTHVGICVARFRGIKLGVVVQDIMSNAAVHSGIKGSQVSSRGAYFLEKFGLTRTDGICTIHPRFASMLSREYAIDRERIEVIYNWSHISEPTGSRQEMRDRLGWKPDEIVVLHSGNMGLKQNLEVVVDAARLADERVAGVRFVLAGDGNQRAILERLSEGVQRLDIIDAVAESEFPELLQAADVLLVNERQGAAEMSVPSKLTSYLAAGRPVLAAVDLSGATAELVTGSGAGVVTIPGSADALLDNSIRLGSDAGMCLHLGLTGKLFAKRNLDSSSALLAYQEWIERLAV